MKNTSILVADTHLTSKIEDEYRWDIFDFLAKKQKRYQVKNLYFFGDLTDKKDRHESSLVNRLIEKIVMLSFLFDKIYLLKGNHDYIDPDNPFFNFLKHIDNVYYIDSPTVIPDENILMLPHTKEPEINGWDTFNFDNYNYVFMHQIPVLPVKERNIIIQENIHKYTKEVYKADIYSGDLHKPCQVENITYIGSPYPIIYGDTEEGRVLLFKKNREPKTLKFKSFKKYSLHIEDIEDLYGIELEKEDWVKITFYIEKQDMYKYNDIKKDIKNYCSTQGIIKLVLTVKNKKLDPKKKSKKVQVDLNRKSDLEIFDEYCNYHKIKRKVKKIGDLMMKEI